MAERRSGFIGKAGIMAAATIGRRIDAAEWYADTERSANGQIWIRCDLSDEEMSIPVCNIGANHPESDSLMIAAEIVLNHNTMLQRPPVWPAPDRPDKDDID